MKLFRLRDFLSFGILSLVMTALSIYVHIHAQQTQAKILMWIVTSTFWAIYGALVFFRARFLNKVTFVTNHGINVVSNEFNINQEEFEEIVNKTISSWEKATKWDDVRKSLKDVIVYWKTYPVEQRHWGKLAGFALGRNVVVGWRENLDQTALGHELGHIIYDAWKGQGQITASHRFMKKHKLF